MFTLNHLIVKCSVSPHICAGELDSYNGQVIMKHSRVLHTVGDRGRGTWLAFRL